MVEINTGATIQCYFSKVGSFDGIFLKFESFNGMNPNFPNFLKETVACPVHYCPY